ncbi:DUF4166 domain-containing protein [uncultured Microbacterium sp.]|uniref:DUF4166 domain-containing protein n=1 Tax=uncultured Microbacterium sp. TaxID=191216 RepID=UPI0025F06FDD|nr:DUF4166 domain-containing protein [uncultured Microbacterium sp.]
MTSPRSSTSPYAVALGRRIDELPPRVRAYFSPLPEGAVGIGRGELSHLGTPGRIRRRVLAPLFRRADQDGAVCADSARNIAFSVRNRGGDGLIRATRTFHLPDRTWVMHDVVSPLPGSRVRDRIGRSGILVAVFAVDVEHGALVLRSTRVGIRISPQLRLRLPQLLAPRIRLTESDDVGTDRQRVALTVDMPLLGRIYAYAGTFAYEIRTAEEESP